VARKLGLCDPDIIVHIPGGAIEVSIDDAFRVVMTGSVTHVATGRL
jgi:diaminopimelate epimerase